MNFKKIIEKKEKAGVKVFKVMENAATPIFIFCDERSSNCYYLEVMCVDEKRKRVIEVGEAAFLLSQKENAGYITALECDDEEIGKIMLDFIEDVSRQCNAFCLAGRYDDEDGSLIAYKEANYEIDSVHGNIYKDLTKQEKHNFDIINYKAYFERYPNDKKR